MLIQTSKSEWRVICLGIWICFCYKSHQSFCLLILSQIFRRLDFARCFHCCQNWHAFDVWKTRLLCLFTHIIRISTESVILLFYAVTMHKSLASVSSNLPYIAIILLQNMARCFLSLLSKYNRNRYCSLRAINYFLQSSWLLLTRKIGNRL